MAVYGTNSLEDRAMNDRNDDILAFDDTLHRILDTISRVDMRVEFIEVFDWLKKVFLYNVPHGKGNRITAVVDTVRLIAQKENRTPTEQELEEARILGWTCEILHANFIVLDDIMDQSFTRRGQLCWFRKEDVGMMACNDSVLLLESIYHIFCTFFSKRKFYTNITDIMHQYTRFGNYGQCLDNLSNPANKGPRFDKYTPFRYYNIIKYKTAYYSFVLPVRLAMYMCSIDSEEEHNLAEDILCKTGILFQVQDDFLDCWGDPERIGKIGTDIEEGKCSWPIMMALQKGTQKQIREIKKNFAKYDSKCIKRVKEIYDEMNLKDFFYKEEETKYQEIMAILDGMKTKSVLDPKIFKLFVDRIYKRQK